ncbi:alpha-amylase family protein [uncultured Ruthenibacterium sp.]|uniref:alpha-amylase family protein n=1 Tax=uncultured Ruthenibacterium sp. TaxID=1905347 RepID=UPI00349EA93A
MPHWWETTPWRMIQTNLPEHEMAGLDAETYAKSLKDFGATVVNVNAAGIAASYDTSFEFHPRSEGVKNDLLRHIVDACHAEGIRVIARTDFSRIRRDVFERHPDWAARLADGNMLDYNGYVSVCPNSEYRQKQVFEILKELLETHPFDGLFCNMSGAFLTDYNGRFYGVCQCQTCRARYKAETGKDVPNTADPRDPSLREYTTFQMRWNAQYKEKLTAFVKQINPELAVNGVDFLRSEAAAEYNVPNWVYKASSNSRSAAGPFRDRPSDNASVDYIGFRHRFLSVSPALMALRQWQNLANSGCLSMYIVGRLDSHRDTSGFEPTRRVFQFHKQHENLFSGLTSAAQTVLVQTGDWQRMDDEAKGWVRILTESHIPFDEIPLTSLKDLTLLAGKKLVILPDAKRLTEIQAKIFDTFAESGGTVLATGNTALGKGSAQLACLGVRHVKETRKGLKSSMLEIRPEDSSQFRQCAETPYIDFGDEIVCVEPVLGASTYLQLIPEHPFGPPECCRVAPVEDIPGLIVSSFGKGHGVYLPWRGGALYQREGYANPLRFLQDVLFRVCGMPELAPDLTPMAELTLSKKDGVLVVQFVNTTGCFANSFFEPVPLRDVCIMLPGIRGNASTLCGGTVRTEECGDALKLTLDVLNEYEAIVINLSNGKGI